MRSWRVMLGGFLVLAAFGSAFPASAPARQAAPDDVVLEVCLAGGTPPGCLINVTRTTQLTFGVIVRVTSTSGQVQSVQVRVELPSGLQFGANGPTAAQGCSKTAPVVCDARLQVGETATFAQWLWDIEATAAGEYTVSAVVTTTEPDPQAANNADSLRLTVAPPTTTPPAPRVQATQARVKPSPPRAGATVTASVQVRAGQTRIMPAALRCTGTIGAKRITGVGRATRGVATCLYGTRRADRGKRLRLTVAFRARGISIRRSFTAALI